METSPSPFAQQSPPDLYFWLTISGYSQPRILSNITAILETGTGVNNSYITANIHVAKGGYNWGSGGTLVPTDSAQNFIYAFSPSVPSGGAAGSLKQHVSVGTFTLDLT